MTRLQTQTLDRILFAPGSDGSIDVTLLTCDGGQHAVRGIFPYVGMVSDILSRPSDWIDFAAEDAAGEQPESRVAVWRNVEQNFSTGRKDVTAHAYQLRQVHQLDRHPLHQQLRRR